MEPDELPDIDLAAEDETVGLPGVPPPPDVPGDPEGTEEETAE